jgi:hypothetical protein
MENRACSDGTSPMQVAQAVFDRLDSRSGSPDANTDLTHLIEETN